MASGLALALGAGVVLAILVPLAAASPSGAARVPELVQAHGWAQLQGFAGLFAAGMGCRLLPRLCGTRPLPAALMGAVLVLLLGGAALRVVAQAVLVGPAQLAGEAIAGALGGAGMVLVAAAFAVTLARSRRPRQGWWVAAWAAAAWWGAWAVLTVIAGVAGAEHGGLVPARLDAPAAWVALLGAIGNLVWAIQARSVPVFYGRQLPAVRDVAAPLAVFDLGLVAVLASAVAGGDLVRQAGLALAGAAMVALAPLCGSVGGTAHRLHPGSRGAAVFVVTANRWAVLAGGLLVLAPALALGGDASSAGGLEDAALHAVGLGLVTTLIPGVARLLAPVFAIARTSRAGSDVAFRLIWLALTAATALRVLAGLVEVVPAVSWREPLVVAAGSLAWIGLLLFAGGFVRAWLRQSTLRARLRRAALARRP